MYELAMTSTHKYIICMHISEGNFSYPGHTPRNGLLRTLCGLQKVLRRPVRGFPCTGYTELSGPDPLRFLRVALRIEISTRCVFCVAGRIFIGFLSLPNLVLKLNLNMSKRLQVEAAYRSKTLAHCGSNLRFETSGSANSSTKMAY